MKDKSFVLRSSRITSKTYSTITPTFVQALSNKSSPNEYQSLIQSNLNTASQQQLKNQLEEKDKQLKQRVAKLTSNLKHIERQYKENLKDGFQNKIKSYRLQAVVQRKLLKQTIDQTLRLNQIHDIKEKYQTAIKRKQFAQYKTSKKQQMRQKHLQRLKIKSLQEKRNFNHQILAKTKQLQSKNKSLHDKIISQEKYKDRKKNYLEYWKQQKLRKGEFEQKKKFLQKIVMNTRKIKGLKEELLNVEKRCEVLIGDKDTLWKEKSTIFVTI